MVYTRKTIYFYNNRYINKKVMEKEFETFEYLVKYNGNEEHDMNTGQQIIIVQENEQLINDNKSTEFIAQDENTNEFVNVSCPMFAVNQQPVYFQLNNSSELIPIPANSLPIAEQSNLFENTYLMPNLTVEVIEPEHDIPDKHNEITFPPNLKEENVNMDFVTNKLPGAYAEITLNDEQYEILQQKGWILLEIKDKVFLLDSAGLHEITNDHALIAKLKHEAQIVDLNSPPSGCSMKAVLIPENENSNMNTMPKQEVCGQAEPMELVNGIKTLHQEEITDQVTQDSMLMTTPSIAVEEPKNATSREDKNQIVQIEKKPSEIYFKTEYLLKDIPQEIVLGKTVNGKNLIARVVKGKGILKNISKPNKDIKSDVGRDRNINDKQFAKLVQQVLHGTAETCPVEDVASVETIMFQMFRVPDLTPVLHKHKLIVTKTVRHENEAGLIENQSEPTVVTGRFSTGGEGGFIHIPDMLQHVMKNSELKKCDPSFENDKSGTTISDDELFLHINITETKDVQNVSRVSVMVNKRYLSLTQIYNMKTKHINAVFACTACAKVFKLQEELEDHQQFVCSVEVPPSPNDKEQLYTVVKSRNKMKVYMCNECNAKFVKLKECRDHIRTHKEIDQEATTDENEKKEESSAKKETKVFKCKMCEITYFHSSSLTKHILAKHIRSK